jgi:hypothetical protein
MLELDQTGTHDVYKYEMINRFIQNICYAEHFNSYKYIAAFDNDEVILSNRAGFSTTEATRDFIVKVEPAPEASLATHKFDINSAAVLNDIKCNRLESMPGKSSIFEKYFTELSGKLGFSKPTAYFFNQGYFISFNMTEQIFRNMEQLFNNVNATAQPASYKFDIQVTDWNRNEPHSFNFTIDNQNDFHYAVNLLKIYKTVLQPYLVKNRKIIQDNVQYYDRLFSIVGWLNTFALGKTMHDSRVTAEFSIHFMEVSSFCLWS